MAVSVEVRGAGHDLLHTLVAEGLVPFRRWLVEAERTVPAYVERELEGFLACGDPKHGFAWLKCTRATTRGWCRSRARGGGSARAAGAGG